MKILLVNNHATPDDGASIMSLVFREDLRQRGHDARLFASNAASGASPCQADYLCFGSHSRLQMLLQPANPSAFRQLRRALADFRPDVVHVRTFLWQLSPLILPLLRDVPSLYHVASYKAICPLGTKMLPDGRGCEAPAGKVCYHNGCLPLRIWPTMMLQQKLWRRWRNVFDLVVATSEAVRQRLSHEGIDVAAVISEAIPRRAIRLPLSSPPTVAFAGRLTREKGVDLLLRAFAVVVQQIPDARLLIAGDGPERENLRRLIAELNIASSVCLLGHLSQSEMEQHFEAAWLQVVPSRWAEPFGLVAAEAMMRGTAVVGAAVGALTEFIREGDTGFLVSPGDSEALARPMLYLLNHRDLAETIGRNGHEAALARFDKIAYVRKFISLYEQLCRRGLNRAGYETPPLRESPRL
ncbi:MAG: glycosyltransferase family 4 protein [Candidatus Binatia bacterium]